MADAATAADARRSLRELLDTLPQELYDEIYEEVFTIHDKSVVIVHKDHKPPAGLQVDSASRAKFAQSYYDKSIFVFSWHHSYRFVHALPSEHCYFITDFRASHSLDRVARRPYARFHRNNWDKIGWSGTLKTYSSTEEMWRELAKEGLAIETEKEFVCNDISVDKSSLVDPYRCLWQGMRRLEKQGSPED